jgi:hypothetical protein
LYGGTIAGDLAILGGPGRDEVSLGDTASFLGLTVNGYTAIFTGRGNDALDIGAGQVQFLRSAVIHLGHGDDSFTNSAVFHEPAHIHLGDGNDAFVNLGTFLQRSHVLGGRGTDTFLGSSFNVMQHSFEIMNP